MNFIDKLKDDISFYEKHERNLLDGDKLKKLRNISNRITGVSYVTGFNDERVIALREYVVRKEKIVVDRMESLKELPKGTPVTSTEATSNILSGKDKQPLLTLELQDESSVPTVHYKGERIQHARNITLDWDTDKDVPGGMSYSIEHIEKGNRQPTINRIERRVKGHAMD